MGRYIVAFPMALEDADIHVAHGAPNIAYVTKRGFDAGEARIGKKLNTVDARTNDKTNRSGHDCSSGTSCLVPNRL
jgi:hypothetical protein